MIKLLSIILCLCTLLTRFVRLQHRICKAVETLEYFTSTEWEFTNENIFNIENEMNETDRKVNFTLLMYRYINNLEFFLI